MCQKVRKQKTRAHHQHEVSGRGTTGTAMQNLLFILIKDTFPHWSLRLADHP